MPLIQWHEQRFLQTQKVNFGQVVYPSLEKIVLSAVSSSVEKEIRYKCRVVYDAQTIQVEFVPYSKKTIEKLVVKVDDTIEYGFKYSNRKRFDELTKDLRADEEVLIVKNDLLTDTSFTNIALFDGEKWYTPSKPLLQGVQRAHLLSEKIIFERNIRATDLPNYFSIKLFNALNDWEESWTIETKYIIHN